MGKEIKPCKDCGTTVKGADSWRCKKCADIVADEKRRINALKYQYPEYYSSHFARLKAAIDVKHK